MSFQLQPFLGGVRKLPFQSYIKAMALNTFFLPSLGSNSLEMNNGGFQQVLPPQPWESKTDSASSLLLWSHLIRGSFPSSWDEGTCPSVLRSQAPSSKDLLWREATPSALSPRPGSVCQELWGRCRCFASNIWKLCHPSARHSRILYWNCYIHVIPMPCMRTDSL